MGTRVAARKSMSAARVFVALVALGISVACTGHPNLPAVRDVAPQRQPATAVNAVPLVWMVKESSDTAPILAAAVQSGDYISTLIACSQPSLVSRVGGWSHVYGASNSSETGATPPPNSLQYALGRCPTGQVQFYDGEHWPNTPENEQDDPAGAILGATAQTHAAAPCGADGFLSYDAGTTPDGIFEGWNSCSYNPQSAGAFYNELANSVNPIGGATWVNTGSPNDWQHLDYYNTQAQTLLSQTPWDLCYGSIPFWLGAVEDRFATARAGNPTIHLWTEYSFGNETEQQIVAAMQAAAQATIRPEADIVEYPITATPRPECPNPYVPPPPPHSYTTRCTFATPQRLSHLVQMLGRPTPTPSP